MTGVGLTTAPANRGRLMKPLALAASARIKLPVALGESLASLTFDVCDVGH